MARGRMKLARILSESKREKVLHKRKEALTKRLQTLCVLCNAKACMVICDGLCTDEQNVWPSRQEAEAMMSSFMGASQKERSKKAVTLEKFMEQLVMKEREKLEALQRKNDECEMEEMLNQVVKDPESVENNRDGKFSRLFFYVQDLIEKIN